jgi:alpha-ketoglutarate-dependent taurine dioxygenase
MTVHVKPIKPHIGAIIQVDRRSICDAEVIQHCHDLMDDRAVLVFPQIGLSDAEQLEFTDRLGARVYYATNVPGGTAADPDVYKVTLDPNINDAPEYVLSTFFWHFDGAHGHTAPPKATLLSAHRVSAKGGQTEFANTYAAYERLPESDKAEIEGLRVRHSIIAAMRPFTDNPTEDDMSRWRSSVFKSRGEANSSGIDPDDFEKEHPICWTHSSGRKSLVLGVSADRVVGMTLAEGRALLTRLLEWTVQPDFVYRHQWREGDLVICNNPGALHRAIPYAANSGRAMHRTTVAGLEMLQ